MTTLKTSFPLRKPKKIPTLAETPALAKETSDLVAAMKLLFQGQQIFLNSSSEIDLFGIPMSLQLVNVAGDYPIGLVQSSWGAGDYWTQQTFMKSRGATFNAHGDVLDGDHMGTIAWYGSKNSSWFPVMDLSVTAESPDADSVPARFRMRAFNQAAEECILMRATALVGTGALGIGIDANPVRTLHPWHTSAATNSVVQLLRLTHTTTGTPAAGIGVGIEFEQETSASNNEVIAAIEAIVIDATGGSEDAGISFKTMRAGAAAAEAFYITANGGININGGDSDLGEISNLDGFPVFSRIATNGANFWSLHHAAYGANADGVYDVYSKTRGATVATQSAAQANDVVMQFSSYASDGSNYIHGAIINTALSGTASGGLAPMKFQVRLQDAGGTIRDSAVHTSAQHALSINTALTNLVAAGMTLTHNTSGTPANGIGVGINLIQETSANNLEVIGQIDAVMVDVTAGSEDSALVFYTISAGSTVEQGRLQRTTTATHTSLMLYDVDNNTVERVTVGAADSGGAGFKVLRIPN